MVSLVDKVTATVTVNVMVIVVVNFVCMPSHLLSNCDYLTMDSSSPPDLTSYKENAEAEEPKIAPALVKVAKKLKELVEKDDKGLTVYLADVLVSLYVSFILCSTLVAKICLGDQNTFR